MTNATRGHLNEHIMEPTISVCRKGNDLYFTLQGDLNQLSSGQLFHMLTKLLMTSLKCYTFEFPVAFTFKTHGKVFYEKTGNA